KERLSVNTSPVNKRLTLQLRPWRGSLSANLQLARDPRQRWNETHVNELLALQTACGPDDPDQRLDAVVRPDGCDQDAVHLQPIGQAFRNPRHRRGDDDTVEKADVGGKLE